MSTSSKGASRNGRPPKLRLSCDSCAAAKVKCGREQPECERCITNGTPCVYGPSRRSGKPPRDPNRHAAAASVDAKKPNPQVPQDRVQQQQRNADPMYEPNGFNGGPNWPTQLPNSLLQWPDAPIGHSQDAMSSTGSPFSQSLEESMFGSDALLSRQNSAYSSDTTSSTPWPLDMQGQYSDTPSSMSFPPFDFQDLSHSLTADRSRSISTFASASTLSSDFGLFNGQHPMQQIPPPQVPGSCGGRDCYTLAYSTLASLHFQQSSPPTSQDGQTSSPTSQSQLQHGVPSLDSVLSNNKAAIQNVLQLLTCPCAADAHMALLYASITSKILIWYQVAAGTTVSSSSPTAVVEHSAASELSGMIPMSGATTNAMNTPYSMGSTFADEPVKIGTFSPDEECQAPMRQILLLGELGRAGVLIDALSRMHGSSSNGGCKNTNPVTPTGPAKNLYATLGSWLKAELARTTNEVKNGSRMQLGL